MRRSLYRVLVSLHPRSFRDRFGPEMIEIFDHELKKGMAAKLLLDGAASVLRQRLLRPPASETLVSPNTFAHVSGELTFQTLDDGHPRGKAFVSGAFVSIVLLVGLGFLAARGSSGLPGIMIGAKYPRPTVLSVDRASVKESDLTTELKIVSPEIDPLDGVARVYFEVVRVLKALDANRDRVISAWEIVTAASPLRGLDRNGDKLLDAEECGLPTFKGPDPSVAVRARLEFMKVNPVLKALDADGNGVISFPEIDSASIALRRLDKNGDGSLSPAEVLPERIDRRAAMILSKLDKDRDRRLSRQEWSDEEAGSQRALLSQADRDGDGIVTEAELTRELTLRDEARSIEERATRSTGKGAAPSPANSHR